MLFLKEKLSIFVWCIIFMDQLLQILVNTFIFLIFCMPWWCLWRGGETLEKFEHLLLNVWIVTVCFFVTIIKHLDVKHFLIKFIQDKLCCHYYFFREALGVRNAFIYVDIGRLEDSNPKPIIRCSIQACDYK